MYSGSANKGRKRPKIGKAIGLTDRIVKTVPKNQRRVGAKSALKLFSCAVFALSNCLIALQSPHAEQLPSTVKAVKSSIVAVGTFQRTRTPPALFRGTGFIIGDGRNVLTSAHVLPEVVDKAGMEALVIFFADRSAEGVREAKTVAIAKDHDIAVLEIGGQPLKPMRLGDAENVQEGQLHAFTGFPLGLVLGLHAVTHRGIISAISPIAIPTLSARRLNSAMIKRLRDPIRVFQLDATAYPGNSGSPLYTISSGEAVGIINSVFVKKSKENLIEKPSGISYAVPISLAKKLLEKHGIKY